MGGGCRSGISAIAEELVARQGLTTTAPIVHVTDFCCHCRQDRNRPPPEQAALVIALADSFGSEFFSVRQVFEAASRNRSLAAALRDLDAHRLGLLLKSIKRQGLYFDGCSVVRCAKTEGHSGLWQIVVRE